MFAVDIKALKPGVHRRDVQVSAAELALDDETLGAAGFAAGAGGAGASPLGPIDVDLTMTLSSGQIVVEVEIGADAWLVCDRTLEPYLERIEGRHQVFCAEADSDEEEADDFVRLEAGDETLDLTDAVRDTVLLAVPLRRVSPEGAARDLATRYGEGAGTDPRWDALKALRSGDEADPEGLPGPDAGTPNGASPAA